MSGFAIDIFMIRPPLIRRGATLLRRCEAASRCWAPRSGRSHFARDTSWRHTRCRRRRRFSLSAIQPRRAYRRRSSTRFHSVAASSSARHRLAPPSSARRYGQLRASMSLGFLRAKVSATISRQVLRHAECRCWSSRHGVAAAELARRCCHIREIASNFGQHRAVTIISRCSSSYFVDAQALDMGFPRKMTLSALPPQASSRKKRAQHGFSSI